jgi:hypothetical protein
MLRCLVVSLAFHFMIGMVGPQGATAPSGTGGGVPRERTDADVRADIQAIRNEAKRLGDPLSYVRVEARALNLLWASDPLASRQGFEALWRQIANSTWASPIKEMAENAVLRQLYPLDPTRANGYLRA